MPEAVRHAEWLDWLMVAFFAVGGWATVRWLFRLVVRELLAKDFAKRSDVDGVGSRVNALETVLIGLRDHVDDSVEPRLKQLEAANEYAWQPMREQFDEFRENQVSLKTMLAELGATLREFIRNHDARGH